MSSSGGRGWIIPGGKVDPREADNPSISAIREAREEGGVVGEHSQDLSGVRAAGCIVVCL